MERFLEDAERIRPAPEDLDRLMRMKAWRSVARDRTVRLDGRLYEAPDGFVGEKVEVLYDPYDPGRPIHLRRRGESEEYRLRLLDAEANARLRRVHPTPEPATRQATATGISYLDLIAQRLEEKS